jgi:hypothetical protein
MGKIADNLRKIFGIRNNPPPVVPPPTPPVNREAALVLGGELISVCRAAAADGLTLKGTLDARREAVKQTILTQPKAQGQAELDALKAEIQLVRDQKAAWTAAAGDVVAVETSIGTLTAEKFPEAAAVNVELQAIKQLPATEDFGPATNRLAALKVRVKSLEDEIPARQQKAADFLKDYAKVKTSCEATLALGDEIPAAKKVEVAAFKTKHDEMLAMNAGGRYQEANDALKNVVQPLLAPLTRFKTEHELAKAAFTSGYAALQTKIAAVSIADPTQPPPLAQKQLQFETAHQEIQGKQAAFDFIAASGLLAAFTVKLGALKADRDKKTEFDAAFSPVEVEAKKIEAWADPRMPASLTTTQSETKTAYDAVIADRDLAKYPEAIVKVGLLKTKVETASRDYTTHASALKDYDAALKKLKPRDTIAKAIPTPPADPMKALHTAYTSARAALLIPQNARNYPEAKTKLALLSTAIDNLLNGRKAALLADVDTAIGPSGTPDKVKDVVNQLAPEEIAELGAEKQVGLLKQLRKNGEGAMTTDQNKARFRLYHNIPLDPTFAAADKIKRDAIINDLKTDPKFLEAKDKWDDPTFTDAKRKEFLLYAANKQCASLGHTPKDPVVTFVSVRKCRNAPACADNCRTGTRREFNIGANGMPNACPTCGDSRGFYATLGECGRDYPATITLSALPEAGFGNLSAILDTVIHENTHAYQNMLIEQFRAGTLLPTDPQYKQAMLFVENDEGYVGNNADPDQALAYQREPLELHAMTMGPLVRDGLLGPKPTPADGPEADLT